MVEAQVAGSTLHGVSSGELRDVTLGWSAKRQILGQPVCNNMDQRIGAVEDIIATTDKSVSYAIINPGGFTDLRNIGQRAKPTLLLLHDGPGFDHTGYKPAFSSHHSRVIRNETCTLDVEEKRRAVDFNKHC